MISFLIKVWHLTIPYRGRLAVGVLAGLIAGLMEPLLIIVVTIVYQMVFSPPGSLALPGTRVLPQFVWQWIEWANQVVAQDAKNHTIAVVLLVATIPGVMVLRAVFGFLNVYLLQWAAVHSVADLRTRLLEHLLNLSAGFFNRTNSGELMSRVLSDTAVLQSTLGGTTAVLVKDPVTLAATLTLLTSRQPKLLLISLIVLPLCVIPVVIFGRKARRAARTMQARVAGLSGILAETFTGYRIIKAFNLETTMVGEFRTATLKMTRNYMRLVRSNELPGAFMEIMASVGVALVLLYLALEGGRRANSSDFLIFTLGVFAMYRAVRNLARLHNNIEQARAASHRVFALLETPNSIREPASPKPLSASGADIYFDNIEFAFGEKPVLRGVTLTVAGGRLLALVGASGSGKTTLTNLLLRFYDPQRGAVRIGGTDIREVSTRDLRNQMAVVTQETILFNQTIRRNIELGRPGASDAEVELAARHAHAHEFIMEMPQRYDTVVGERGMQLSGGQRQRIAIARAILKNAPILILDEATSSLDTQSEMAVQAALEKLMQGRTTICIAHRLSTIQKSHTIAMLDAGRVVEQGRHDELFQQDGAYRNVHRLQFQLGTPAILKSID